ncbi:MAG: two pore domain potassium channel family protein [Solirubrobacterales bacterium]|nr:two pore domain potassium channel family protein [Solirubrobacterales bacterium]
MTAVAPDTGSGRQAQYRYGAVFLILLVLLVFEVVAPDGAWARAIVIALSGAALSVTVATSREPGEVRRHRALLVGAFAFLVVLAVGTGLLGLGITFAVFALLLAAIPVGLIGGLARLIRERGVTVQAVAGALAIYLLVGLLFAAVIAFVGEVESGSYFRQAASVSNGVRVYYSFTVLTTTGFGDYSAATPVGHALAVLEMLTGQLYLVTVIGIVVGNFAGQRRSRDR